MVIYLGSYSGKAKTTGNEFYRYTLAEVRTEEKSGKLSGRVFDFFAPTEIKAAEGLSFGDIVTPEFRQSELLGGKPDLIDLEKVGDSPYKQSAAPVTLSARDESEEQRLPF